MMMLYLTIQVVKKPKLIWEDNHWMIRLSIVVVLILNWNNLLMRLEDLNIKLECQQ